MRDVVRTNFAQRDNPEFYWFIDGQIYGHSAQIIATCSLGRSITNVFKGDTENDVPSPIMHLCVPINSFLVRPRTGRKIHQHVLISVSGLQRFVVDFAFQIRRLRTR